MNLIFSPIVQKSNQSNRIDQSIIIETGHFKLGGELLHAAAKIGDFFREVGISRQEGLELFDRLASIGHFLVFEHELHACN